MSMFDALPLEDPVSASKIVLQLLDVLFKRQQELGLESPSPEDESDIPVLDFNRHMMTHAARVDQSFR